MEHTALTEALREKIAADALGELDEISALQLKAHTYGCVTCRRELKEMQAAVAALAYSLPPILPSPTAEARLTQRVAADVL